MQEYTGRQWLLINLATHFGKVDGKDLDKQIFEDRLAWGRDTLADLMNHTTDFDTYVAHVKTYVAEADEPEEFSACAIAIWDVLNDRSSNYVVGLDACNSGAQIMSAMGRCIIGMKNTGLINTGIRPDLYQVITDNIQGFFAERKIIKKGTVPHLYGSYAKPVEVFGEENYDAFIESCIKTMPMVEFIKDKLINAWNSKADAHTIFMPDAGVAHMKVIDTVEYTGRFKGFNYTFHVQENKAKKFGEEGTTSLGANIIHPYDAYVLRELERRCDYNQKQVEYAKRVLTAFILTGECGDTEEAKLLELQALSKVFNIVSFRGIEHVVDGKLAGITEEYAMQLLVQCDEVLSLSTPFNLKCIHDEFGCLPNYVNTMKKHYNRILADTYMSTWIWDTIQLLTGDSFHHVVPKADLTIYNEILNNNYSIC